MDEVLAKAGLLLGAGGVLATGLLAACGSEPSAPPAPPTGKLVEMDHAYSIQFDNVAFWAVPDATTALDVTEFHHRWASANRSAPLTSNSAARPQPTSPSPP